MSKAKELASQINKILGSDTIILGSDPALVVEYLSTGLLPIDILLKGGIPKGRFIEIFGGYSTLKSYIGLCTIAETQKVGGTCALIDTEGSFDPEWAEHIGVSIDDLILLEPETGELAIDATELLIRERIDLIVWDSVAATLPKSEAELQLSGGKNLQPARLAALMSAGLRKLTSANTKTAILCINQTRINVGQMFGNPEQTTGGRALGYYSSIRVALRKAGNEMIDVTYHDSAGRKQKSKKTIKQDYRAKIEKSKLNAPYGEVVFTFDLVKGEIDTLGYLIGAGIDAEIIERIGNAYWKIKGEKEKHHGLETFKKYLMGKPELQSAIEKKVRKKLIQDGEKLPRKKKVVLKKKSG